jgi:flagellar biosynthesis chaperone FliJ
MTKPTRETRETIENELHMNERERLVQEMGTVIRDIDELEAQLQALEKEAGLPTFYQSKPITERMAHLGMSREAIDSAARFIDVIEKLAKGRGDEMSDATKRMLAEAADAELSAVDQLAAIIESRPKS